MKKTMLLAGLVAGLAALTACDSKPKTEPQPTPPAEAPKGVADAVKPAAEQAVKAVTDAANTAVADATAKADALLAQAKTLIGQNKFTEALSTLQQVSSLKLTPEQEKLVASLKEQVQKALAATSPAAQDAAGAVNQLLKK